MKEIRRLRKSMKTESVENFKIMNDCCYFHTLDEFSLFDNEDDNPSD